MFRVSLCNDSVINVMTLSLAEKDVSYSMAAAGSAENFDASIPNYTASHSGDRAPGLPNHFMAVLRLHVLRLVHVRAITLLYTKPLFYARFCFTPFRFNAPYRFTHLIYPVSFSV